MVNTDTPKGYARYSGLEAEGWFNMQEGARLEGNLLGRFVLDKKNDDGSDNVYFQIETMYNIEVWTGKGKERCLTPVEAGAIVNLSETSSLKRDLTPLVSSDTPMCVLIIVGEKKSLDGGKTFWPVEIFGKRSDVNGAATNSESLNSSQEDESQEGLPF